MNVLKIIGVLLVLFGATDLIGSFAGFDLWGTLGVALPDLLWKYSAYLEIGAGALLFNLGSGKDEAETEAE